MNPQRWILAVLLRLVASFCCPTPAIADITLAKIFTDHLVLQQQTTIKIWGTAEPQENVIVQFMEQKVETVANDGGQWSAQLQTPVAGGPFKIEVSNKMGEPKIVLSDVMIGEVWICSGQSNMQWPVRASAFAEKEIDAAGEFSNVRLFTVAQHASNQELTEFERVSGWNVTSPTTVADFSAVAYFFGRYLHKETGVPIGLINTSWGGTSCEAWTSMPSLQANEMYRPMLQHWETIQEPLNPNRPANLYNGMIAPLKGFKFRGAIWYQGESNVGRGDQYRDLFANMIGDWRANLAGGDAFPFYFAQIAPFRYGNRPTAALAEIWDAQLHVFRNVPQARMATTCDIGDLKDIHPANKQDVGKRLALWALHDLYSEQRLNKESAIVPCGPVYREMKVDGARIRLKFDFAPGGLVAAESKQLSWFTICGADGKFVPAQAIIEGDEVVVWADEVTAPQHVRFAWDDSAVPNLFNQSGLPAAPFRTDSFDLLSKGVKF